MAAMGYSMAGNEMASRTSTWNSNADNVRFPEAEHLPLPTVFMGRACTLFFRKNS